MTRDDVVAKFHRYTEPALGQRRAGLLVGFVLDGEATTPAHRCFVLAH
jgi:hypothetical protein